MKDLINELRPNKPTSITQRGPRYEVSITIFPKTTSESPTYVREVFKHKNLLSARQEALDFAQTLERNAKARNINGCPDHSLTNSWHKQSMTDVYFYDGKRNCIQLGRSRFSFVFKELADEAKYYKDNHLVLAKDLETIELYRYQGFECSLFQNQKFDKQLYENKKHDIIDVLKPHLIDIIRSGYADYF